ncbi:MAG TPA: hypothetical protein VKM94_05165 [Blastocatellia bacterium]|nr:hypothetical protein [Blastocatellia bacterium]
MNGRSIRSRLIGTALTAVALITLITASSSVTQAQYRDYGRSYGQDRYGQDRYGQDRYDRYRYDRYRYDRYNFDQDDVQRIARNNGYRDGFRDGRQDRIWHREYNFEDNRSYRFAMSGYRWGFGDREFYRESYRDAYRHGYERGFRQFSSWPY